MKNMHIEIRVLRVKSKQKKLQQQAHPPLSFVVFVIVLMLFYLPIDMCE